jgi:hypothetical protein
MEHVKNRLLFLHLGNDVFLTLLGTDFRFFLYLHTMTSQATDVSTATGGQSGTGETAIIGSGGNGGNGSRESSEFEFIGNRQITPNPLFFHANQQSLLFQTVQETEGKYHSCVNAFTR